MKKTVYNYKSQTIPYRSFNNFESERIYLNIKDESTVTQKKFFKNNKYYVKIK